MAEVNYSIATTITEIYNKLLSYFPLTAQTLIELFLLVLVVFFYAWFIWKLYRFIATKNLLGLNLNKYNKSEHPFFAKLLAGILYFVEYILLLPFIIFFWFVIFTIFLMLLTDGIPSATILLISAIIISVVRMTSYYNEDLSRDVAKMLPFTLLGIAITTPRSFNFSNVISHFSKIPDLTSNILTYLGFIIVLEIILRFMDFLISLFGIEEIIELEKEKID
jgi:hypothetical protein